MVRGGAQPLAGRQVVELDHDAVDLVADVVAALDQPPVVVGDLGDGLDALRQIVDPEAPLAERPQRPPLRLQPRIAGQDVVDVDVERPRGGDAGVELAQRAGGGVARIGEGLAPLGDQPFVQGLEVLDVDDDLTAHGQKRRHRPVLGAQLQRHGGNGPHVGGDVLAPLPVAAGRGPGQGSLLVDQLDRGAVELGLEGVGELVAEQLPQPLVEPPHGLELGPRVEAQHRRVVLDGGQRRERLAAHPLGRRVRRHQLGVLLLERLELAEERVVGLVRDLRPIEHVVQVLVLPQLLAQLRDPLLRQLAIHRPGNLAEADRESVAGRPAPEAGGRSPGYRLAVRPESGLRRRASPSRSRARRRPAPGRRRSRRRSGP